MILMCEAGKKKGLPNGYVKANGTIKYLNQLFDINFSEIKDTDIHKILQKANVIKTAKHDFGDGKLRTLYWEGTLKAFTQRPWQYNKEIARLAFATEDITGLKINETPPYQMTATEENEPKETPWDETNMDFVNQQLLDKYQFD